MSIPANITILLPWQVVPDTPESKKRATNLSAELRQEVPSGHVLHGLKTTAVAARVDQDDVLFEVEGGEFPLAVVHITWRKETDPKWPHTVLFASWQDWVRDCMLPDHEEYMSS